MTDKPTILDTPEQLMFFRLCQFKYALKIELRTGLTHSRGSIKRAVETHFDKKFKTKQEAYDFVCGEVDKAEEALGLDKEVE